MKKSIDLSLGVRALLVFTLVFVVLIVAKSLQPHHRHSTYNQNGVRSDDHSHTAHKYSKADREELYSMGGSSLPDCSHACGACYPCRRVMVSFKCVSITEPCPVVYRCMCKGKYYHVPSN